MNYEEYLQFRKNQIKDFLSEKLADLSDESVMVEVLDDAVMEYQMQVYRNVSDMYRSIGLNPEIYQLENYVWKIENPEIKASILNSFFDLDLLQETILEVTGQYDEERPYKPLDEILIGMSDDKRKSVLEVLTKNVSASGSAIDYIGSGETCTVFGIGDKVVKFGSKRRYDNIPYCLDIYDVVQYDKYSYMYVTDKIETGDISTEERDLMYQKLRDNGYVWVDPKHDNIGRVNGQLKILDDVDIYTEQEALSTHGKKSVLEFVDYDMKLAMLEVEWLRKNNPDFSIDSINDYYSNFGPQNIARIDEIKTEFNRRNAIYDTNQSMDCYSSFGEILSSKISEINNSFSDDGNKVV